jgi:hypothetical protein
MKSLKWSLLSLRKQMSDRKECIRRGKEITDVHFRFFSFYHQQRMSSNGTSLKEQPNQTEDPEKQAKQKKEKKIERKDKDEEEVEVKIIPKQKKSRRYRRKHDEGGEQEKKGKKGKEGEEEEEEDGEEEERIKEALLETKERQKMRQRVKGVDLTVTESSAAEAWNSSRETRTDNSASSLGSTFTQQSRYNPVDQQL